MFCTLFAFLFMPPKKSVRARKAAAAAFVDDASKDRTATAEQNKELVAKQLEAEKKRNEWRETGVSLAQYTEILIARAIGIKTMLNNLSCIDRCIIDDGAINELRVVHLQGEKATEENNLALNLNKLIGQIYEHPMYFVGYVSEKSMYKVGIDEQRMADSGSLNRNNINHLPFPMWSLMKIAEYKMDDTLTIWADLFVPHMAVYTSGLRLLMISGGHNGVATKRNSRAKADVETYNVVEAAITVYSQAVFMYNALTKATAYTKPDDASLKGAAAEARVAEMNEKREALLEELQMAVATEMTVNKLSAIKKYRLSQNPHVFSELCILQIRCVEKALLRLCGVPKNMHNALLTPISQPHSSLVPADMLEWFDATSVTMAERQLSDLQWRREILERRELAATTGNPLAEADAVDPDLTFPIEIDEAIIRKIQNRTDYFNMIVWYATNRKLNVEEALETAHSLPQQYMAEVAANKAAKAAAAAEPVEDKGG